MSEPADIQSIVDQAVEDVTSDCVCPACEPPEDEAERPCPWADTARRAARHAAEAGIREGLRRGAEIAREQEEHWRREKRLRGNYKVNSAISECERVASALRSAAEGQP